MQKQKCRNGTLKKYKLERQIMLDLTKNIKQTLRNGKVLQIALIHLASIGCPAKLDCLDFPKGIHTSAFSKVVGWDLGSYLVNMRLTHSWNSGNSFWNLNLVSIEAISYILTILNSVSRTSGSGSMSLEIVGIHILCTDDRVYCPSAACALFCGKLIGSISYSCFANIGKNPFIVKSMAPQHLFTISMCLLCQG